MITFCHLFMMNVARPSQSGKKYWIYKLLKHIKFLIEPVLKIIMYLHGTEYQPLFDKMKN